MKRKNYIFWLFIGCLCLHTQAYANNPPPTPGNPGGPYPELPINGGVFYLLLLGLIYGITLKNRN